MPVRRLASISVNASGKRLRQRRVERRLADKGLASDEPANGPH
jgi:hypothetical protein